MIDKAQQIREIADKHNVLLHSHAFVGSVDFAVKEFGEGVTKDLLKGPTLFAHCNGLREQEVKILGECSTGIAVVPFTHENLWYGVCPVISLVSYHVWLGQNGIVLEARKLSYQQNYCVW